MQIPWVRDPGARASALVRTSSLLVRVGEDFLGDKHRTAVCDAETGFAFAAD